MPGTASHTGNQAIVTTYHGPTDRRGSRITARCAAGRITVAWDHALGVGANHAAACAALVARLGWGGRWWIGGSTSSGHVFVCVPEADR